MIKKSDCVECAESFYHIQVGIAIIICLVACENVARLVTGKMMNRADENLVERFFEGQIWQISILAVLFFSFYFFYDLFAISEGQWLGLKTRTWYLTAIITPIIHQMYVWLCWRGELYFNALSRIMGRAAYLIYSLVFFILIFIRFFAIVAVCIADYKSFNISAPLRYSFSFIIHLPALYAIYSVVRYFGFRRTPGEDHFKPEEYRQKPFVKEGMYKYSSNVMYVYVGLIFLALAVFCASKGGLILSLYMYATVWTHYFCTEKPDIRSIYYG